jgi:putative copper export protein
VFLVAAPALRTVEDLRQRVRAMRVFTTRFNYLAWGAMAVLVLTGISNVFDVRSEHSGASLMDLRWGVIFITKMVMVAATITLTAIHSFWTGPRILDMQEQALDSGAEPADLASIRRASIVASSLALLASVAVLFLAALLATPEFAFEPR